MNGRAPDGNNLPSALHARTEDDPAGFSTCHVQELKTKIRVMRLRADNVQQVLGVPSHQFYDVLPKVFEQLVDPELDEMALYHFTVAIRDYMSNDERPEGHMGFDSFEEAAFEGGIVKTMMEITQDPRTDKWHGLSAYFALDSMWHLMRTGRSDQRRELLKQLLEHKALEICLDKVQNHPLIIHRQCAVNLLRSFASESFLGELITRSQTSDVMVRMCEWILAGHSLGAQQMGDPSTTWQSFLCFGKFGAPREKAARYAPRYYAMSQENAAWTVQGLVLRVPPPNQGFCYEVLKHNPALIDLLFRAAAVPRPAWYPESAVDSILCEAITMLFRLPQLVIPGVIAHDYETSVKKVGEDEWKGLLDSLNLLTSRPNWIQLIANVWEMIEDERWQSLKQMVARVKQDYHAQADVSRETLLQIFEYRGSCRICMLRLIATITHLPNCGLSEGDLLMLLRISNAAVRPVKKMHQISSEADTYTYIENALELFRKPLYSVFTQDEVEPPLQVADEPVLGPTAHTRLLTLLAERNALQKISKLAKPPKGVYSRATLAEFKCMTSPEGIQQFLATATKRVTARREEGHKRFREKQEMDYACIAYFTAAELAAALVAFDRATDGLYRNNVAGMRREVVLCLGNAAEMALLLKQFQRALYLATGAVEAAERLPSSGGPDSIDKSITEKNQRRVERARAGLS